MDVETLLKVGTLYPEIAAQEREVDSYIDLLRQDQVSMGRGGGGRSEHRWRTGGKRVDPKFDLDT